MKERIDTFFHISERGSSISKELLGGFTTFLTMAYIVAVNPTLLSAAGIPFSAALTSTCIGAAAMTLLMGLVANRPLALASGMGINAIIAYTLCLGELAVDWRVAMSIVFFEGIIILILVLSGLRKQIMEAIPVDLRCAIAVGIGLLIAFIGLQGGEVIVADDSSLVSFGDITNPTMIISLISIAVAIVLQVVGLTGGVFISIAVGVVIGIPLGVTQLPDSWVPTLDFSAFAAPFQTTSEGNVAFVEMLLSPALLLVAFSFLVSDFFDTLGALIPLSKEGEFATPDGKVKDLQKILAIDSTAAAFGGFAGASSITLFAETAAGIAVGARTGLCNIVIAALFLLMLLLSPVVSMISGAATSGALVVVGYLMCKNIVEIKWSRYETSIPAFITILFMPLAYSITDGIGLGFITYCIIMLCTGKAKQVMPLMWVASAAFLLYFLVQ